MENNTPQQNNSPFGYNKQDEFIRGKEIVITHQITYPIIPTFNITATPPIPGTTFTAIEDNIAAADIFQVFYAAQSDLTLVSAYISNSDTLAVAPIDFEIRRFEDGEAPWGPGTSPGGHLMASITLNPADINKTFEMDLVPSIGDNVTSSDNDTRFIRRFERVGLFTKDNDFYLFGTIIVTLVFKEV